MRQCDGPTAGARTDRCPPVGARIATTPPAHFPPSCPPSRLAQDSFTADAAAVCLRNCTCPADGGPCALDLKCSVHIDIAPRRGGASGGTVFFWMVVALLLGGGGAMGWVHMYGVPPWLPIRERGYQLGLYNELSEHGGI